MSVLVAIVLLLACNAITVGAILFVRRRAPQGSYFRDTTQAAGVFTVAGTAYAVLLAFVFLLAFQSYNSARSDSEQEAAAVGEMFHLADPFPVAPRSELQGDLICYARSVVSFDWPAMRSEETGSAVTQGWINRMDGAFGHLQPRTPKQVSANDNWPGISLQRKQGRAGRLIEARPLIPGLVWVLLVIGSVVVIVFVGFFADRAERPWVQAMLMISVTTMLVAGLIMIRFFDQPFASVGGAIEPDAMRKSVQVVEAAKEDRLPPPCDHEGRPIPGR